ncbi:hypothetical protein NW759_016093 [Fusarium solani]|nr:hypothetical protein NW759_016093 [Fusarium solani]
MFIDASYEGDLMEQVGVPYRTGHESKSEYGESLAGVVINTPKLLTRSVDPYVVKGDPGSGLIAGEVSTDLFGRNFDSNARSNYALYSYARRKAAAQEHKLYTQGFLWTLANHPRVPASIRKSHSNWGYAKDEFVSNGNSPYELYIREGRRMGGVYTMTQEDVLQPTPFVNEVAIATGSYFLDVHAIERVLINGKIYNEGSIRHVTYKPFPTTPLSQLQTWQLTSSIPLW